MGVLLVEVGIAVDEGVVVEMEFPFLWVNRRCMVSETSDEERWRLKKRDAGLTAG